MENKECYNPGDLVMIGKSSVKVVKRKPHVHAGCIIFFDGTRGLECRPCGCPDTLPKKADEEHANG